MCCLKKHRQSSQQKEGIASPKCRRTRTRPDQLCSAMIKVSYINSPPSILVEQYGDSPNHTHSLEEIDMLKHPKTIRSLVEHEAAKNYPPPAIIESIKAQMTECLGLGDETVQMLRWKEVANIQLKLQGPLTTYLMGNPILGSDIQEAINFLKEKEYHVEHYHISQKSTKGFVFAHPQQLEKLWHFGWMTLINSTHKTNQYDW
jgi:hypothetical protein